MPFRTLQPVRDDELSRAMLQAADHVLKTADIIQGVVEFAMPAGSKHDEEQYPRIGSGDMRVRHRVFVHRAYDPFIRWGIARFHDPADCKKASARC